MSIRDLGDWSPLGRDSDPVRADMERLRDAAAYYRKASDTLDGAVTRLDKIASGGTDAMKGKYVDQLRDDATSVRDNLAKAAVRYRDAAHHIEAYLPELQRALDTTRVALEEAGTASRSLTSAEALPDGVPDDTGALPAAEATKDADKRTAVTGAQDALAAARRRMDGALAALDVAGRTLGDAVNCKRYDDGLTDTLKDRILHILDKISKVLTIIAMVLAILCIFFPGIAALVAVAAVTAVVSLGITATLYANGKEGLPDLLFSILGVVTLGFGTLLSLGGKAMSLAVRSMPKNLLTLMRRPGLPAGSGRPGQSFEMVPVRPPSPTPSGSAGGWKNESDWFNNPLTNWLLGKTSWGRGLVPEIGFWQSSWRQTIAAKDLWKKIIANPRAGAAEWAAVTGGWAGFRSVAFGDVLGKVFTGFAVWGGVSTVLTLGLGLAWAGGRYTEVIPVYAPLGGGES